MFDLLKLPLALYLRAALSVQSPARSRGASAASHAAVARRAAARLDLEPALAVRLPPEEDELELSELPLSSDASTR